MIKPRQKREPAVGAVELCAAVALAIRDLREFAELFPTQVEAAIPLFPEHSTEIRDALETMEFSLTPEACACGKRASHRAGDSWLCCVGYVTAGNPPAAWHPACMATWRIAQDAKTTA